MATREHPLNLYCILTGRRRLVSYKCIAHCCYNFGETIQLNIALYTTTNCLWVQSDYLLL